jgi:hypothetical protein
MDIHDQLFERLTEAAEKGHDPVAILQQEHDHLVQCSACREKIIRLSVSVLKQDLSLLMAFLEDHGLLQEPSEIPEPELSFLAPVAISTLVSHPAREEQTMPSGQELEKRHQGTDERQSHELPQQEER